MRRNSVLWCAVALVIGAAVGVAQAVPPVSATVVVKEGDSFGPGLDVSGMGAPFTDGNGKVGFVGQLSDGQRFIWWDTGPVFFSGDELSVALTGGESTMGVSNTGGFIYSPSVDGDDAVYTQAGVLLKKTDYIPSLDLWSSFNSRPTMIPDGTAYWIGGTTTSEGSSTTSRQLFKADPTDPSTLTRILGGGDMIDGKAIKTTASNFTYWIANNGLHHIHELDMDTGSSSNDTHIYVDGAFVAQETLPTGQGDNWDNFDLVSINSAGNYIFTGDTDGPTSADEFLAYNSSIVIREGDTLAGVELSSGWTIRGASMNELEQVIQIWGSSSEEHLFFSDLADLDGSLHLLATGDEIDVNDDGIGDYIITDFNSSATLGPGIDFAEDGMVYVEVDMESLTGREEIEAILGIVVPEPSALALLALGGLALLRRR